jgi:hypothetical protein
MEQSPLQLTNTPETNAPESSTPESNAPEKRRPWRLTKLRLTAIITFSALILALIIGIVIATQHSASQSNSVKSSGQWVTIQTFSGSGSKKTSVFTVSNNWRIVWSCDPASHNNTDYTLFIRANTTTNVLLNNSVETTCSKDNTHSFSQIAQGGKIYLSILSEGSWRIQVQDLR